MDAPRDGNFVPSALFESSTNPRTVLPGKINESTGKILVETISGNGDVVGPASSTDNAVARFDGVTGKLLQNSVVTIDDTGNVLTAGTITSGSYSPTGSTVPSTGIYLASANELSFSSSNTKRFSLIGAAINSANGSSFSLATGNASSTAPTFIPNRGSTNTGFGAQASGNISGIIGGVELARWTSVGVEYPGGTPTHTITLGSTATGLALYNTADQITNYERVIETWSGNVYTISTSKGGTGVIRNISIGTTNTKLIIADTGGSLTGPLRADAGVVSVDATITSGTYTPTLTNVTNVTASTARLCTYMRVGNTVTVAGQLDIDPTITVTATELGISLPIASAFTTAYQCGGTASAVAIAGMSGGIMADATNDRASLQLVVADPNNNTMTFTFTYQVI